MFIPSHAQIIYAARGSNRSWEWLAIATVCIYALRDIIKRVKQQYKTSYNGTSHTSPNIGDDIQKVREYFQTRSIQQYANDRAGKKTDHEPRDLVAAGMAAFSDARALSGFRDPYRRAHLKVPKAKTCASSAEMPVPGDM
jgi:hypothetical protein